MQGQIYLLFIIAFHFTHSQTGVGPYEVKFQHLEQCEDFGTGKLVVSMKMKRLSRVKIVFDFNITLGEPLDDNILATMNAGKFTNNGIKDNYVEQDFKNLCSLLGTVFPKTTRKLFKQMGVKKCPVPVGTYHIYNLNLDERLTMMPIFFYNKYRVKVQFKRLGVILSCYNIYAEVIPKKNS